MHYRMILPVICDKVVTAPIRFAHGAACWTYAGPANTFTGKFKAGQRITVRAIVERHEDSVTTDLDDAQLSISGTGVVRGQRRSRRATQTLHEKSGYLRNQYRPLCSLGSEVVIKLRHGVAPMKRTLHIHRKLTS